MHGPTAFFQQSFAPRGAIAGHGSREWRRIDATNESEAMNGNNAASNMIELAADVVSAYVSNHSVPTGDLPGLIGQVYTALQRTAGNGAEPAAEAPKPAVPVKRSVTPDYIVCLEDGKHFKSLKRHLRTRYNLTPAEYRAKWGLPADYPMVAPNYAEARSRLAKQIGLGQQRRRDA